MNNKNFFIVAVVLIFVAIVGMASYLPTRVDISSKVKVADFPKTIGEWVSTDIPLSDDVYRILETRNLFVREYKNTTGDLVYLYLVYSEDNRKVSHPPEVCLLGSGITIADKSPLKITESIKGIKLVVEKADTRELVAYWYKAGNLYTDKYLKQQFKIVIDRTFGKRTSGALIRLSTQIKGNDEEEALKLLKSFARLIEPLLTKYVP